MKKLIYCMLAVFSACLMIQGCEKATEKDGLILLKSEVMINEPDTLRLRYSLPADKIAWTVSPAGFNTIVTSGGWASLTFTKAGTYLVSAIVNNGEPRTTTIVVNTTVYTPPNYVKPELLTGDQINIIPALYRSSRGDTTYIYLNSRTANSYCPTTRLNVTGAIEAGGNYVANFINLLANTKCTGIPVPIQAVVPFKQSVPLLANGTYPLTVNLNGTAYTGTIAVSAASIIFNWNYTSGVIFTTRTLTR